jgi:hypothetical protein
MLQVDYMYDVNLAIKNLEGGRVPKLNDIKNGIPLKVQVFMRRIPTKGIPTDNEKDCAAYLYKLYKEKVCFV